jgi:hypothetical protein
MAKKPSSAEPKKKAEAVEIDLAEVDQADQDMVIDLLMAVESLTVTNQLLAIGNHFERENHTVIKNHTVTNQLLAIGNHTVIKSLTATNPEHQVMLQADQVLTLAQADQVLVLVQVNQALDQVDQDQIDKNREIKRWRYREIFPFFVIIKKCRENSPASILGNNNSTR